MCVLKRVYGAALAGAAAVVLAACGGDEGSASGPAGLVLTEEGLGTIGAETAFTVDAVRAALPGRDVRFGLDLDSMDADERVRITLRMRNVAQAHFFTDVFGRSIVGVEVVGEEVRGPDGLMVGSSFQDAPGDGYSCSVRDDATAETGALITCRPLGDTRLTMLFQARKPLPSDNVNAGSEDVDAVLERMMWRAPDAVLLETGFNCGEKLGPVETAICGAPDLADLDRELNDLYPKVRDVLSTDERENLRTAQIRWIEGRDDCWRAGGEMRACITDIYAKRLGELRTHAEETCDQLMRGRGPQKFSEDWWAACAAQ